MSNYSKSYAPTRLFFIKKVNQFVKGKNILDLGVKDGFLLKSINIDCKVGIDIEKKELEEAKTQGIKTIFSDLNNPLPLEDNSFDNIICIETLEHVFNFQNVLTESRRILKPNGVFVVGVPYHGLLKNIAICFTEYEKHYIDTSHVKFFTPNRLKKALKSSGFQIMEEYKFGRVPFLWRVMLFVATKKSDFT